MVEQTGGYNISLKEKQKIKFQLVEPGAQLSIFTFLRASKEQKNSQMQFKMSPIDKNLPLKMSSLSNFRFKL